jgi:histidinol-phosphate aminotransferase
LGLEAASSEANFVMAALPEEQDASVLAGKLLREGVIVRPLRAFGLPHCLRISAGTDEDNAMCVEALKKVLPARAAA